MKITNKLHRGTAITAGVIFLIALIFSVISAVSTLITFISHDMDTATILTTAASTLLNAVSVLLMAVVMLRGKKDTAAGVVFILLTLYVLLANVFNVVTQFLAYSAVSSLFNGYIAAYLLLSLLAGLANVALRVLICVECFKPGKLSGSGAKVILVVTPVLALVLSVLAYLPYAINYTTGQDISQLIIMFLSLALGTVIGGIAPIIMGISFSIPVKEAAPAWSAPEAFQT